MNTRLAAISLALACVTPVLAADFDWQFLGSGASGLHPVGSPTATADIHPGALSGGWNNTWNLGSPVPGNPSAGYWDLGKGVPGSAGYIELSGLGGIQGTELKVVQWYDGLPFAGGLTVSVNGAALSGAPTIQDVTAPSGSLPGQWKQYVWVLPSAPSLGNIIIQGPDQGSIVGRIELTYVPEPYHYGLISLLGMLALAGREAFRQKRFAAANR